MTGVIQCTQAYLPRTGYKSPKNIVLMVWFVIAVRCIFDIPILFNKPINFGPNFGALSVILIRQDPR